MKFNKNGKQIVVLLSLLLMISFGIALPLLWLAGAVVLLAGIVTSLIMLGISHRHFKGVTGDVLGATNELTRMVSLITLLAVAGWL